MKIRNTIFAIIFCAFLLGPAGIILSDKLGLDLPGWATAEDSAYLVGGITSADVTGNLSYEGFAEKKLQTALEGEVNNHVPLKFSVLLTNAAFQKCSIEASNAIFDWSCYPTYFGSNILYDPKQNALSYLPLKTSKNIEERWKAFARGVAETAERYPDKRFLIYIPQGYETPAYNAAYDLVTHALLPQECIDVMSDATKDIDNVSVLTKSYENESDYFQDYYSTDHHWNINGAYTAYAQIAEEFGLKQLPLDGLHQIEGCVFHGSLSRSGLLLLDEEVYDSNETFNDLVAITEDGSKRSCSTHAYYWNSPELARDFLFYDRYYTDLGEDFTIKGGQGDRKALLVTNSYRGPIQRFLGYSYNELVVNVQLSRLAKAEARIDDQIKISEADDIIFVACPMQLMVSPKYWEAEG